LLGLVQGSWPPTSEIDRRVSWFRKKVREEKIDSEAERKYAVAVRYFLLFLERTGISTAQVDRNTVAAFVQEQMRAYCRIHRRRPASVGGWRRRYLTGIQRFLRLVQGKWPPSSDPDLEAYQQHLRDRGIANGTILDYCLYVRILLEFLRTRDIPVENVQPKNVEDFYGVALRMYRKQKPNGSKSITYWRTISRRSIRSFLRFKHGEWPPDRTPVAVVRFKQHLQALRYRPKVIVRHMWATSRFVAFMEERGLTLEVVRPADIEAFLQTQTEQYRRHHRRGPAWERKWRSLFRAPIYSLLRMIDPQWPPRTPPANAQDRFQQDVCDGYGRWLTDVQGLSTATLRKNGDAARVFLRWLHEHAHVTSLRQLNVKQIDAYLAWRLPDLRRATRHGVCSCLRSFLGYLHTAKLINRNLAAAVSRPSLYQFEDIPRAFTQDQIEAVLATTRRDRSPTGLRDYAMLLMLATYGLRSGEVLRLRLEDIEWREERFRIRQSKTGLESFLPLMPAAGEALLNYLKGGRPQTERREVFLRVRAPFTPLAGSASFASLIFRRLQQSGIEVKGRHGAHAFRFARALSLLRASVSAKWIGDLLGHRQSSSTNTYLRLATEDLRALSLEVPGRKK
jgi:integrase/recombinase XerD